MAWEDRLTEAAYTSPSGERIVFLYEDLSVSATKKTSGHECPDTNGTYVQDRGHSGRRFPLQIILTGPEYDTTAEVLFSALLEKGVGRLEHPRYGVIDVVPFGDIVRNDAVKSAGNQAVFEVTFWETIREAFPTEGVDAKGRAESYAQEFSAAASVQFSEALPAPVDVVDAVSLKATFTAAVKSASARFGIQQAAYSSAVASVNAVLTEYINDPLTMAAQALVIAQMPAKIAGYVVDRIAAYAALITDMIAKPVREELDYRAFDLFISGYVSGAALTAVYAGYETKKSALTIADEVLRLFDLYVAWRDDTAVYYGINDSAEVHEALQGVVMSAVAYLIGLSFTLRQEISITLDRPRTAIDLCAELYGEVDSKLDFLIESNNLVGSEILELPMGRKIVYYV